MTNARRPANPIKGEIAFDALGQRWIAVSGFLARVQIEEEFDEPAGAVIGRLLFLAADSINPDEVAALGGDQAALARVSAEPERLTMLAAKAREISNKVRSSEIAKMFGALLSFAHPDVDERTVLLIINDLGDRRTGEIIGLAVAAAQPPAEVGDATGPRKASRPKRTGTR